MGELIRLSPAPIGDVVRLKHTTLYEVSPGIMVLNSVSNCPTSDSVAETERLYEQLENWRGEPRKILFLLKNQSSMPSAKSIAISEDFPYAATAIVGGGKLGGYAFGLLQQIFPRPYPTRHFSGGAAVETALAWLESVPVPRELAFVDRLEPGIVACEAPAVGGVEDVLAIAADLAQLGEGFGVSMLVRTSRTKGSSSPEARSAFNGLPLTAVASVIDTPLKRMVYRIWMAFTPPPFPARSFDNEHDAMVWLRSIRDDQSQRNT